MVIKIFVSKTCPKCPAAKELGAELEKQNIKVEYWDIGGRDGLAEAAFFSVLSTPSIIVVDNKEQEVTGWRGEIPSSETLSKALLSMGQAEHGSA